MHLIVNRRVPLTAVILFTFTAAILVIEQYFIHPLTLFKPELHSFHGEPSWASVSCVLWQLFWILQTRSASASSGTVTLLKSLAALTARVEGSDPPRLSVFFSSATDFLHFFSRTRISRPRIQNSKKWPHKTRKTKHKIRSQVQLSFAHILNCNGGSLCLLCGLTSNSLKRDVATFSSPLSSN